MDQHIHESNLIENIDDPREDKQSMSAWLWLLQQKKLDHSVICHLQKRIVLHQSELLPNQKGYYRGSAGNDVNVRVGPRVCPHFTDVRRLMDNWLATYKFTVPITGHVEFEKIHPFVDGNGRTGRMLLWWQELHRGELPTLFLASERHQKYYPMFAEKP